MYDYLPWMVGLAFVLLAGFIALFWMLHGTAAGSGKPRRFCPLCKSELVEGETLKGLIVDTKPPQKILIRGCTRCAPKDEGGSW